MKLCSAALKTFLEGPDTDRAVTIDLYTIRLVTGEEFRWSAGNASLTVPSAGFPADSPLNAGAGRTFVLGPGFDRSTVATKVGLEPATLDLAIYAKSTDTVGTLTLAQAIGKGLFDGAMVELDRFFAPGPPIGSSAIDTSLGCLVWFYGRVAEIEVGRSAIRVTVKSLINLLEITQFPRRVFGANCTHVFGAPMCGYNRVAGTNALGAATGWGEQTITATAGSTQSQINSVYVPALSPSPYIEGTIIGATGANTGFRRTISAHASGTAHVKPEFIFPVAVGDTFDILPGCNHTTDMCDGVLQNIGRYGGYKWIPQPEAAI
ncbi:MAG: DUF2163 domain-containing protein [Alphaproteobacteria bacterium]